MPNRDQALLHQLVPRRRAQGDKAKPRFRPLHLLALNETDGLEQQLHACSVSPDEHRASKGALRGPSKSRGLHIWHHASQGGSCDTDSDIDSPVSQRPLQEPTPPAKARRGASRLGRLYPDPLQLRAQPSSPEPKPGNTSACQKHWPQAAGTSPASTPGVPDTPPGVLRALQPAWLLQPQLPGKSEAPSAAAIPAGHRLACHTSHLASGLCSSDLQASALQVIAGQHQSQVENPGQQSSAPRQLPTPGSSLSSLPLGQEMLGSRGPSHGSCPMSVGCGLATSQSLAMSKSSVAEVTPGSGAQAQLFLQALAAHKRPAAESMEQRLRTRKSCSRLQCDSRAGRGNAQLLPGSDATSGCPQTGSSPCLAQGLPMCVSPALSDSTTAPQRRAAESLPASRAASEACPAAAGAGHPQRSSLTTAAAAQAAGRQQPGPDGPNRAAATLGQAAHGLGCSPACGTPPSPAVCAALWLYGTSQSQQPSAGLPAGGPLQPVTAAHALAAGLVSNCDCKFPDARPGPAKVSGGPSGKRSAEAAPPFGAGTADSPEKRHRVQLPAPAPQAARAYLKALAQPAPVAIPLTTPSAQAGTVGRQPQQQQQQTGEQAGAAHGHVKPLAAGVSWYELHRPSEQAVSQQAEQENVEWRMRHLQAMQAYQEALKQPVDPAVLADIHCLNQQQQWAASSHPNAGRGMQQGPQPHLRLPKAEWAGSSAPCTVAAPANAHKVWRAFAQQRDALDYAERCNWQAAAGAALAAREGTTAQGDPVTASSSGGAGHPRGHGGQPEEIVKGRGRHKTLVAGFLLAASGERAAEGDPAGPSASDGGGHQVFCVEQPWDNGFYRSFLAASYQRLWPRFNQQATHERHYYEVIPADTPCHLYFDLEYVLECNPGIDGAALTELLLKLVARQLKQLFDIELQPGHVWELDSSQPNKFSRHIVVCLPKAAFASSAAVGTFVALLLARHEAQLLSLRKPLAQPGSSGTTCFVDTAVYSRNRHFRTAFSSKGGKSYTLQPTGRYTTASGGHTMQDIFLGSLVCNVTPGVRLLKLGSLGDDWDSAAPHRLMIPNATDLGSVSCEGKKVRVSQKSDELDGRMEQCLSWAEVQACAQRVTSFLEGAASELAGGLPACVRTIAHCGHQGTVAISMFGPGGHFCQRIGRCHQSNYVYYVVNLLEGTYAQKCHDPDCANFRSALMPLPEEFILT